MVLRFTELYFLATNESFFSLNPYFDAQQTLRFSFRASIRYSRTSSTLSSSLNAAASSSSFKNYIHFSCILVSYLNIYKTSEIVITFLDGIQDQRHILQYLEIAEHYHYSVNNKRPRIDFQNNILREVYQIQSLLSAIEHLDLERSPMITESLAILIHFVVEHDMHIVQKLDPPNIIDNKRFMSESRLRLFLLRVFFPRACRQAIE